jgi:flagellar biosynthesis anti-sigma factor FlgM
MKINDWLPVSGGGELDPTGSVSSSKKKENSEKSGPLQDDAARLSLNSVPTDPQLVDDLSAAVKMLPEVRQDRVDSLQRSIQDGSYHVTVGDVAAALMADMLA